MNKKEIADQLYKMAMQLYAESEEFPKKTPLHYIPVLKFIYENKHTLFAENAEILAAELYHLYVTDCMKKNIPPVSNTLFGIAMQRTSIKKKRSSKGSVYYL